MTTTTDGVMLANSETGSTFFHRILTEATRRFPVLAEARLPSSPAAFKKTYGEALVRFEAARIGSPDRVAIAHALHEATLASFEFRKTGAQLPLATALAEQLAAPRTTTHRGSGEASLVPEVPLDGRIYRGAEVADVVTKLHAAHHLTDEAARALRWMVEFSAKGLDLSGERFVVLGASAELSPLALLRRAGATVRCLDVKTPVLPAGAGTVITTDGDDDLLSKPQAAMAAVREFAADGPVHLGLFAYAPGASRELRLAGVMDAMVRVLGPSVVKSVSFFVSPTSPGEIQPEDFLVATELARAPKIWQRGFQAVRMLRRPGHVGTSHSPVARSIISLQGASYQAAQYLTKLISAECLATAGLGDQPLTLSANVAGITNTKSLSHPMFQVGFKGATHFGLRVFDPDTTRALSGMLMLHDLLNPAAPGSATRTYVSPADRARAVRREQIHGGVYGLPWQFESLVVTAAVLGTGQRPDLLLRRAR